jgi:hypothetical protein
MNYATRHAKFFGLQARNWKRQTERAMVSGV